MEHHHSRRQARTIVLGTPHHLRCAALGITFASWAQRPLCCQCIGVGSARPSHETRLCPHDTLQDRLLPSSFITARPWATATAGPAPDSDRRCSKLLQRRLSRYCSSCPCPVCSEHRAVDQKRCPLFLCFERIFSPHTDLAEAQWHSDAQDGRHQPQSCPCYQWLSLS